MKPQDLYHTFPTDYPLCFNADCALAATCLRQIAARTGNRNEQFVLCVNPAVSGGNDCASYRPDTVVRMAYGMIHLYDQVLARDLSAIRSCIMAHFGNGSYYLRRNGKRAISPGEQAYIVQVFRKHGYEHVAFDRYQDEIDW